MPQRRKKKRRMRPSAEHAVFRAARRGLAVYETKTVAVKRVALVARVFAVKMFSERTSYPILFYLLASDEILYSMRAYMRGTYKWLESLGCLHQIL